MVGACYGHWFRASSVYRLSSWQWTATIYTMDCPYIHNGPPLYIQLLVVVVYLICKSWFYIPADNLLKMWCTGCIPDVHRLVCIILLYVRLSQSMFGGFELFSKLVSNSLYVLGIDGINRSAVRRSVLRFEQSK